MNDVVIREAEAKDVDTLFRWGEDNWELWGDVETKWYTRKALSEWISHPRDDVLLVAEADGRPVGMCFSYYLQSWAYCAGLYVEPEVRRQGIARRLVDETVARLKAMGTEALVFLAEQKNRSALSYYRKTGCKQGGTFLWMYRTFSSREAHAET